MPHNLIRDNGDFTLIARFVAGDEAAFETLFRAYQHRFLMLSRRFLNDHTEAEDAVQEAFVDIYHGLKRFRHNASFQTWAYRIVVRKCSERRKRTSQRNMATNSLDTLYALSAPDTMPVIDDMLVQQALLQLPDDARLLLILKYYEEFSSEEIAQILDCNLGQAKMRVHRAKNSLKDILKHTLGQSSETFDNPDTFAACDTKIGGEK